ncbi:MAG: enoyl-CoA hydratase/isomerase family protein [Peptococcaceae bacterium]|jgi:enoyl-CoA hydratase|nr:enoyl-CoA hydratase/isomerase family protein [Peptococcaceae bacterium]
MKSIDSGELLYSADQKIANVTINRPEKMNALDSALIDDLYELFCQIDGDETVRAVVVRGAGGKAFVAGADIGEIYRMRDTFKFRSYIDHNVRLFNKMMTLSQPIIAAINGYAFGGGCALAMSCDLVVATDRSKFGTQEINMGFVGNGTALTLLAGKQKAAEMTMLGGVISAEEAYRLMLVNRLVPPDKLEETVSGLCEGLLRQSSFALKMAKQVIYNALDAGFRAAGSYETDAATVCYNTPQCQAAIDSFVNKR